MSNDGKVTIVATDLKYVGQHGRSLEASLRKPRNLTRLDRGPVQVLASKFEARNSPVLICVQFKVQLYILRCTSVDSLILCVLSPNLSQAFGFTDCKYLCVERWIRSALLSGREELV